MRSRDLVRLALSAMFLHKLRTSLTTLGVIFGSLVLLASLSIRHGVQDTIVREYTRYAELRQIEAYPRMTGPVEVPKEKLQLPSGVSAARRQRLEDEIRRRWQDMNRSETGVRLTPETLGRLAALNHVQSVQPDLLYNGRVLLGERSEYVGLLPTRLDDDHVSGRVVAGAWPPAVTGRDAAVTEYLLYQLGIVEDEDVERTLGKKLRLEFRAPGRPSTGLLVNLLGGNSGNVTTSQEKLLEKILPRLPEALAGLDLSLPEKAALRQLLQRPPTPPAPEVVAEEFTVRAVLRSATVGETKKRTGWVYRQADVFVPVAVAEELYFRLPHHREHGYRRVTIVVDDADNVKEVSAQIAALGMETHSLIEHIEREQFTYLLVFTSMTIVAVIALLVAAIGIANTMLMSVLERVREIGIMKAVGARDAHVQAIFLVEGFLIGVVGSLLGLLLGWAASFPADSWVRATVSARLSVNLEESIFVFPWWLLAGVPLFACVMTTLAAYYPARRAARVNPIAALRHD
jgi:putative ABC transport system permease protein